MTHSERLPICIACALLGTLRAPASAADCNSNGLEDSMEVAGPFVTSPRIPGITRPWKLAAIPVPGSAHPMIAVLSVFDVARIQFFRWDGAGAFGVGSPEKRLISGHDFVALDVDRDQDMDLVLAHNGQSLRVLWNQNGEFPGMEETPPLGQPSRLILGDFDADGNMDLGGVNESSEQVSVMLNRGSASFERVGLRVGSGQLALAAGDLDGNGTQDLASGANYGLTVILNAGGATFGDPLLDRDRGVEQDIQAGDLNGDGKADLVLSGNEVQVLLAEGAGAFRDAGVYLEGAYWGNATLADMDRDGDLDVSVTHGRNAQGANGVGRSVAILWNDGAASFPDRTRLEAGEDPVDQLIVDFDADGDQDLFTANSVSNDVTFFRNLGGRRFEGIHSYESGSGSWLEAADFDGDGSMDLAVRARATVSLLWNEGGAVYSQPPHGVELGFETEYSNLQVGDFTGDGRIDLITRESLIVNEGGKSMRRTHIDVVPSFPHVDPKRAVDLDGDGDLDVLGRKEDRIGFLANGGSGTFELRLLTDHSEDFVELEAADLDRDGRLDLLATKGSELLVYNGEEGLAFSPPLAYAAGSQTPSLLAADMDSDGHIDVVVPSWDRVRIRWNDGSGALGSNTDVLARGQAAAAIDYDSDGRMDLAACGEGVLTLRNLGGRELEAHRTTAVSGPVDIIAAQLDGKDGTDLAVVSSQPGTVNILLNGRTPSRDCNDDGIPDECELADNDCNANGIPDDCDLRDLRVEMAAASVPLPAFGAVSAYTFSDLDGDGDDDLYVAEADRLSMLRNQGATGFAPAGMLTVEKAKGFAITDLSGDGRDDVAAVADDKSSSGPEAGLDGLYIFIQSGDAAFGDPVRLLAGRNPADVDAVDLDGDGDRDLVVANPYMPVPELDNGFAKEISFFRNGGSGAFEPILGAVTGEGAVRITPGDLEGDGDLDLLVVTTKGVVIYENLGAFSFRRGRTILTGEFILVHALEDLDGDRDGDVLSGASVLENQQGVFGASWRLEQNGYRPALVDVDQDGDKDLFLEGPNDPHGRFPRWAMRLYLNDGSARFHETWSYPLERQDAEAFAAEIDGKGGPEVVVPLHQELLVFTNGTPSFLETDCDENGRLDSCDPDADGDGVVDACDFCPGRDDRADSDGDGAPDCLPEFEDLIERGAHRWFVRADADENGVLDLSDPIFTLNHLFRGGRTMDCLRAQDSNDDGMVDLSDPIYTLRALFLGGDPIPAPHPDCGRDLIPDGLTCGAYLPCSSW